MPVYIADGILLEDEVLGIQAGPNSPRIGIENVLNREGIQSGPNGFSDPLNPPWLALEPSTADRWKSTRSEAVVFGSLNAEIDYVGIAAHKGLVGRQITIFSQVGTGSTAVFIFDAVVTSSDAIFVLFEKTEVLNLIISVQGEGPFEIGIISAGKSVFLPRNIYVGHTPINYGRKTTQLIKNSDSGNFLGKRKTSTNLGSSVNIDNIPPDFYREYIYPKFHVPAETRPFFWAWRPQKYPNESGFCWTTSDLSVSNSKGNGFMSLGFEMMGYADNG